MSNTIDGLTNNAYKTLRHMYEYQTTLPDGTTFIPTSQADLAKIIGVSTITMNRLFKQLVSDGLVSPIEGKRGRYALTDKANALIQGIEELETKIEGSNK